MHEDGHPVDDAADNETTVRNLNRGQRDCFVVGWCSFLAAALGTMLFFAWVDPLALADITEPPLPVDRMGGYALGFFFFWLISAIGAGLTVYLIRTRHGHPRPDAG